jgi:hypothetical protein
MKRINLQWPLVVSALFVITMARGSSNADNSRESDYRLIADRNPFGLKPTPPPQAAAPAPAQSPKSDIKLTGIKFIGSRKAYFMISEPKGKSEYYSLGEGEAKDGLEVLKIDEGGKSVRIRNGGTETLMTFASHGITVAPGAGAPPPPANAGMPGGAPGMIPNQPPQNTTAYNMTVQPGMAPASSPSTVTPVRTIPPRTLPGAQSMDPAMAARYGLTPGQGGTVAQFQGAASPPGMTIHATENRQNLSSEEQIILLELQRVKNQKTNPRAVLPPTPGLPGQ